MHSLIPRIITVWWGRASASSVATTFGVVVCILLVWALMAGVGIDNLTTIDVYSSPLSRALMAISGATSGLFAARAWGGSGGPPGGAVAWLKLDRPGFWWLLGAGSTAAHAAMGAFACAGFLSIAAQHLDGLSDFRNGVVISLRPAYTASAACKRRLVVRGDPRGDLRICLATAQRRSLAAGSLKVGDAVTVHLKRTVLGSTVVSVARTGP